MNTVTRRHSPARLVVFFLVTVQFFTTAQIQDKKRAADEAADRLQKALALTAQQRNQVAGIYLRTASEFESIMKSRGMDERTAKAKITDITLKAEDAIKTVLTVVQRKKYEELMMRKRGPEAQQSPRPGIKRQ